MTGENREYGGLKYVIGCHMRWKPTKTCVIFYRKYIFIYSIQIYSAVLHPHASCGTVGVRPRVTAVSILSRCETIQLTFLARLGIFPKTGSAYFCRKGNACTVPFRVVLRRRFYCQCDVRSRELIYTTKALTAIRCIEPCGLAQTKAARHGMFV